MSNARSVVRCFCNALSLVALTGVLLACGAEQAASPANGNNRSGVQAMKKIEGNVVYRERIMLRPGAEIEVQLEDISRSDAPAEVLASVIIKPEGGPPYPFSIDYDPAQIDARMRYALRARISNGEQLQFTNTDYIDPFSGNPVEVMVHMVARTAAAPTQTLEASRWGLETLAGEPAESGAGGRQVDLEFSEEDGRVGGFAGCNRYNGSYSREGAQQHGSPLSFGEHMAVTMMACPEGMELEQQYLKMLARVTAFRLGGDGLSLLAGAEVVATYRAL